MRIPVQKQAKWWGIAAALLLLVMWLLGSAVLPFILGAGVAYLLDPVADRLERAGLSRTMAVVVITAFAVLIFVIAILLVVPVLVRQATALIETWPQMVAGLQRFLTVQFPTVFPEGSTLSSTLSQMASTIGERAGQLLSTVMGSVAGVISVIALLVIVPVVAFYLLLDWDRMVAQIDSLLPREHAPTVRQLAHEIDVALSGFIRGQGLVMLILGTWYSIALMLVGLPFGFFIGIMGAALSFIPYVGTLIGGGTAIGVALFSFWGDPMWIAAVVAIYGIGQVVEGNYLQPKIVGGSIGLHPVWLLLALSVFGALFGFVGLVAAVPLAAALGVVVRFMIQRYRESSLYTGEGTPPEPSRPLRVELVPRGTAETGRPPAPEAAGDAPAGPGRTA